MANLNGVKLTKGTIGANTLSGGDGISGMIIAAPAPGGLAHGEVTTLYHLKDAVSLGITPDFDSDNFVNCHRHIREFYRMASDGSRLYLMLVDQSTAMEDILEDSSQGANDAPAKKLLIEAEGNIRQLGVAINPSAAPTVLNGMNAETYHAIAKAQGLALWAYDQHFPLQVLLEGRDYNGDATAVADLKAIANLSATKVSVVLGQDYNYAESLADDNAGTPVYLKTFSDVGTALGTVSTARVNQNIGENERFNITDATKEVWMVPALSNHVKNIDQYSDLQTLEDKHFVFGVNYTGLAGVRWNNDHTAAPVVIDAEGNINEHTIGYGRTLDKAVRLLRTAYLPKVKTVQPVVPDTGKLPTGVIKSLEEIGNVVLGGMVSRGEITDGVAIVDPDSDLIGEKILRVRFRIVPYGYMNFIEGTINLKTTIN